jgi:hypothetical protein
MYIVQRSNENEKEVTTLGLGCKLPRMSLSTEHFKIQSFFTLKAQIVHLTAEGGRKEALFASPHPYMRTFLQIAHDYRLLSLVYIMIYVNVVCEL